MKIFLFLFCEYRILYICDLLALCKIIDMKLWIFFFFFSPYHGMDDES